MTINNPVLNGSPVVLVHFETSTGSGLTECTGEAFVVGQGNPGVPRTPCPGCTAANNLRALRAEVAQLQANLAQLKPRGRGRPR